MAGSGVEHWQTLTRKLYRRMNKRHLYLWYKISEFIASNKINSILEIGCGMNSPVKNLVGIHSGIDLNKITDALHEDFTEMDVVGLEKRDLLLACNVIEHCNGYEKFFSQVKKCNFPYTVISFFNGINRKSNKIHKHHKGLYVNKYSKTLMAEELQELGLDYEFIKYKNKESVVIIKGDEA